MESAKGKGQEKAGYAGEGTVLQAVVLRCIDSLSILVVSRKAFVLSPPPIPPTASRYLLLLPGDRMRQRPLSPVMRARVSICMNNSGSDHPFPG